MRHDPDCSDRLSELVPDLILSAFSRLQDGGAMRHRE